MMRVALPREHMEHISGLPGRGGDGPCGSGSALKGIKRLSNRLTEERKTDFELMCMFKCMFLCIRTFLGVETEGLGLVMFMFL